MIIAALILVFSIAFMVQFFVAYCRSLLASSSGVELSPQAHEVTGIDDHHVTGEDFQRLMPLVRLCPTENEPGMQLAAVGAYYSCMSFLRSVATSLAPRVAAWAERERAGCGYYAAVELDRRIAYNRGIIANHFANRY
jgi:hypothetical protein